MAKYVKGGKEEKVSKRPKEYFDQYPKANNLVLPLIHRISLKFEQAMISFQGMAEFWLQMNSVWLDCVKNYIMFTIFFLFPSDALYCFFNVY